MSTIAEVTRLRPPRRANGAARKRAVTGGVLWIVVLAALLAGVVAINVVVLQLTLRVDELGSRRAELKAESARIRAQLSTAAANVHIEREARARLGLTPVQPGDTSYVTLKP